ncbi:hypothetical protein CKM354_000080500 [Cercospora kikuchii]|uniref:Uncharacterized protein n=1 Tax=Cercospora kikuchii TaxID=84275 RepID=A0A9P3CBK2_9PEZI|nr:uncharacterized protein CKM354_000080500 [Cercospora kikuchii]GIZ37355.1 hypothetical protein CKM354_000080500 [Cercospora kikuchii]
MRFSTTSILAATTYFVLHTRALPHPAPPPTYNVVDVGGPTSAIEEPATIYETVKTTLSAKQTVTKVAPAATTPTTPSIATVEAAASTSISSSQWTVVIGTVPTSASSSSTSSTITSSTSTSPSLGTSTPCTTTTTAEPVYPVEQPTHTGDDGLYHPPGDNGKYQPWNPAATTLSSSSIPGYYPVAAATSWAVPVNETRSY